MPRIDELYSALNQQGLYTKSLDDFKNQFSTPEAVNQLHFALKQEGLYTKSLSDFNNQFFSDQLKKKEEALPSMPSAEGGFLGTTPMPQDQPLVSFGEVMPSEAEQSPIFQQYQAQKAQQPQGLEYVSFEQKPQVGLFGEELPEPQLSDEEIIRSYLPANYDEMSIGGKTQAMAEALKNPEVLKIVQAERERQEISPMSSESSWLDAANKFNATAADITAGALDIPWTVYKSLQMTGLGGLSQDQINRINKLPEDQQDKAMAIELGVTTEGGGGDIASYYYSLGDIAERFRSYAKSQRDKTAQFETSIQQDIANGNIGQATFRTVTEAIGSVPYTLAAMTLAPQAGMGGISSYFQPSTILGLGTVTAVNKIDQELKEGGTISPELLATATIHGLSEGGFEAVGGAAMNRLAKAAIGNSVVAKQISENIAGEFISAVGLEGTTEGLTSVVQEGADALVLGKSMNLQQFSERVFDAALIGAFSGGGIAAPSIGITAYKEKVKPYLMVSSMTQDATKWLRESDQKINQLKRGISQSTDPSEIEALSYAMRSIILEKEKVLQGASDFVDNMTNQDIVEMIDIKSQLDKSLREAEAIKSSQTMDDETKKIALDNLKSKAISLINKRQDLVKRVKENAVQKQTTSEVPVQPKARVGEEVAEGAPEAKPEVVTEEGVQEEVTIDTPAIVANTKPEVDAVVAAAPEVETGQTFNSDGTVYSNGGLVVPVTSENITQQELTPERIAEFVEANKAKIGSSAVKVGIYKFPNSNKVSLDLNIVVPKENRTAALEFGKIAGQESLFDLDTFENVKTGADGMNPMSFTDEQFKQIAKSLSEGKVPDFMMAPVDQTAIGQTIQNTAQSLQVAFPEVEFIVGDNLEDTRARIVEALMPRVGMEKAQEVANDFKDVRGQALFADEKPVAIVVDKAAANTRTAGHEAWEVMLNDAFGKNPEKFSEFRNSIDRQLRLAGYNEIATELQKFSEQYAKEGNEVVFREYMAEFGGMLVEGGFDIQNLTPQQKSLLQKIKDIINDFAMQLTGKEVFLKDATAENIIDFMSTISQKVAKGETVEEFFEGASPEQAKDIRSVNQKKAIEILDGPKFDSNKKEDVASFLNGLRESVIPPDSPKEQLIERFINNVYEEVGYYLYSKGDPRAAGLTWYIEDMVEFGNKVKVLLPELSNQDQYKLFLSILAFTSSGTNPNQNLLYAYNLWNNSNDPKNFDFSKNWGDSKMSFIDKNGKAIAAGSIIKETSSQYTVQLVDSVGKLVVDSKGNPKTQVIAKKSLKEGYPKSTGYTNRGEIVVGQLEKLEKLYKDLGSIEKVVKWLETPHPIAELREYNQSVPDVNGNGPGVTNKQYDPTKNAEGERNGAFVFGEKIGSFYQNMIGIGETITMDLWWSRTWNRYMGTMLNTVSGKTVIQETPRTDRERNIMREAVKMVADDLNLQVSELQAAIWYFEQELWTKSGNASPSYSYVTAVDDLTKKLKVDEATRTRLQEARADLSAAEKRKQAAAERAASVVAGKGGKGAGEQITSRSQKKAPAAISEDVYKYLTEDENGNIVFHHYSSSQRDQIKPSSGQGSLLTSKEEQQALSSVGGLAMYYAQEGQKEPGVGNELHTVVVPRDKVYDIRKDPMNFYDEAKERFLEHMNRNNTGKPIEYAFSPNYQVAWITKVAGEKGFDMTVAQWKNKADYRAQSTKTLTPEAENIKMKPIEGEIEVGDLVQIYGQESVITDIDENGVLSYVQKGSSGKFDLPMSKQSMRMGKATLLDKGPYVFDEAKQEPVKQEITARAQKINYKDLPGYDRLRSTIDEKVEEMRKAGKTNERILDSMLKRVRASAVYEKRANDSQREQMERDLKKEFGQKLKSAPKVERVLGIEPAERELVTNTQMIAERGKAAKYSEKFMQSVLKQISSEVMKMKQKGKITLAQMRAIMNRAAKVKLVDEKSVRSFIEYIDRIMNNAEYAEKGLLLNKKLPNAKRNAARKIGIADGLSPLLQKLFSINSFVVPKEVFNDYAELVEMFSDRATVLSLGDIDVITGKAKKVLEAVEGELARAEALAEVFDSYENKVTDKDGKLLYSETINQMVEDGSISPEDGEIMKKYKSLIVERTKKDPRSEEEIEEERLELVDAVKSYTPIYSQLPSLDERNLARSIYELIKSGAVDKMNNKDLKDLLKVLDNIENGFLPHYAQIVKEKMNQINNGESLAQAASKAKPLTMEKITSRIKTIFSKDKSAYAKAIQRNPLFFIDEVFGNFNSRPIFNAVFKPVSQAYSKYQGEINTIMGDLNEALANVARFYGNNPNKTQFAKQKLMAYMLQREFQSNIGQKDVNSAKAFLDETIAFAEDNEQNTYSKKDIENLKEIRDNFFNSEEVDLDSVYETFNKAEKKAIDVITKINDSMSGKVAFTSAIIRGRKVGSINKYVHHNVLMDKATIDDVTNLSIADMFNSSMKPSTKAKSLEERTGKVTPLVFDPFSSTVRGAKYLLMDYHLTEPIRTARRTLNYAKANSKGEAKKIVNAISKSLEQTLSNVLTNSYTENNFMDEVVSYIEKTGYRAMLGSIPRAVSELTSNLAYVALYDPKSYIAGLGYSDITMSSDGLNVMRNSGSQQIERLYPSSKLSGRILDKETMSQASGIKAGRSLNDVANVSSIIYNNSLKKVKNVAETTSDYLISTPDKAVIKPLWFGAYASEFKRITGRDVDFNKIAAGDEVYLTKNKEAIQKSSDYADETSVRVGASDNPFIGIIKGANSKNKSAIVNTFNKFNNFMTRFLIYEYSTARTGVYALMGEGKLTRRQGAAILGATMSRMIVYSFLSTQLVNLIMSALFGPDEDDDDTLLQKITQSTASAFTGMLLGRNFGNIAKAPINYAVEEFNKAFLDDMRTGEYDPYKDAIQYTIIPKESRKKGSVLEWAKSFSGAFSPMISTIARTTEVAAKTDLKNKEARERRVKELMTRTPLEIMGNLGYVPLYKDVRRIVMEMLYKDLRNGKKSGSQPGGVIEGEVIEAK